MQTETIQLNRYWKLVTKKPGLIQFNDRTQMALTGGLLPEARHGFEMAPGSFYENKEGDVAWAKVINPTTMVQSVRVTREAEVEEEAGE